ncbi:urate hydroxylase PuuD [Vibrio hepatarius]|uniref:urate hydroxylase PuuD n=1 Tax=Vibrio hepatarius TaxID=171383 RepID=UPI001C0941D7|nr:urate hydroxylase PuuD [Vibrio hepatarius]MBU2896633.1 urate hydroxylase PuuD [Vibrio hepatarius]
MDPHVIEWLNLVIRWAHMVVGVAWIGASFYFVWLENNLNRINPKKGLSGDLWAIHGGGIYHLEKYQLAPDKMPEHLHWFKWEAYFTWITGVMLLCVIYYFNAELYLMSPDSELSEVSAISIGVASLLIGWIIYDRLCNSPLKQVPILLAITLFVFFVGASCGLVQVFSGRGAYIHIGAMIGTIMVGNVFRVIMPAQRDLVQAIKQQRQPDPALPAKALLRSRHNNYMTLPVLFIMISHHFPSTYGSSYNWAILAGLSALSIFLRHYFNTRHSTQKFIWAIPATALGMIALAFVSSPYMTNTSSMSMFQMDSLEKIYSTEMRDDVQDNYVSFARVNDVIQLRCGVCHSQTPAHQAFSVAPAGVKLDSPQDILRHLPSIMSQAVQTQVMPPGNLTQMTDEERALIQLWVVQGASISTSQ